MPPRDVLWMYDIQTDKQEELKRYLKDYEVRYFFKPMSMQPMYLSKYKHLKAYEWSKKGLYLPTYPKITKKEIQKIGELLWKFTKKK
jgi:perosamine synthetase